MTTRKSLCSLRISKTEITTHSRRCVQLKIILSINAYKNCVMKLFLIHGESSGKGQSRRTNVQTTQSSTENLGESKFRLPKEVWNKLSWEQKRLYNSALKSRELMTIGPNKKGNKKNTPRKITVKRLLAALLQKRNQ